MDELPQIHAERNPLVHAEHRRQALKQIYLPLVIGALVVLAGVVAIIYFGVQAEPMLRRWADVSVIWVLLPAMCIGVLILLVILGILFGFTRLLGVTPGFFEVEQGFFSQAEQKVLKISDGLVEPFLRLRSNWAGLKRRSKLSSNRNYK